MSDRPPPGGAASLTVAHDGLMTSLLEASDAGRALYGPGIEAARRETVPCVTLDQFAAAHCPGGVDFVKIDVQGLELAVLRGAAGLLANPRLLAINSEAPLHEEYWGGSTFFEVHAFLAARGFALYQVHECWAVGPTQRTSCLDCLWVRDEVLDWMREQPERSYEVGWRRNFVRAMRALAWRGVRRVGLFGAGRHTRAIAPAFAESPVTIAAIYDDAPAPPGGEAFVAGVPVRQSGAASRAEVDAVVLSSRCFEGELWRAAAPIRARGVPVLGLYGGESCEAAPGRAA